MNKSFNIRINYSTSKSEDSATVRISITPSDSDICYNFLFLPIKNLKAVPIRIQLFYQIF
jgi:hypothetical protein